MDAQTEKLVQLRDRRVAMQAAREAIRAERLRIAHMCEVDAELTKRAIHHISESRDLIAKADAILGGH